MKRAGAASLPFSINDIDQGRLGGIVARWSVRRVSTVDVLLELVMGPHRKEQGGSHHRQLIARAAINREHLLLVQSHSFFGAGLLGTPTSQALKYEPSQSDIARTRRNAKHNGQLFKTGSPESLNSEDVQRNVKP
jgi:hypothetical protein